MGTVYSVEVIRSLNTVSIPQAFLINKLNRDPELGRIELVQALKDKRPEVLNDA